MAILSNADYDELRQMLYRNGDGKEELKAMANLPNEAQLKAAFQSVEDFWSVNAATLKAGMETALGRPITNPMARKLGKAWLRWKFLQGG